METLKMKKSTFNEYKFTCDDIKEKLGIVDDGVICFVSFNSFGKTVRIRIRLRNEETE